MMTSDATQLKYNNNNNNNNTHKKNSRFSDLNSLSIVYFCLTLFILCLLIMGSGQGLSQTPVLLFWHSGAYSRVDMWRHCFARLVGELSNYGTNLHMSTPIFALAPPVCPCYCSIIVDTSISRRCLQEKDVKNICQILPYCQFRLFHWKRHLKEIFKNHAKFQPRMRQKNWWGRVQPWQFMPNMCTISVYPFWIHITHNKHKRPTWL